MSQQPEAAIRISGDDSPLRQSLRNMTDHMRQWGRDTTTSAEGAGTAIGALKDRFLAISAIIGGGALFGRAIQQTVQYTQDSIALGKSMGQSAASASVWVAALEDVGATANELSAASKGLLKNVRDNEAGLNAMGLATRDAGGNLRPLNDLMLDAITIGNDHKAGTDRQIALQQLFGKGLEANSNLLKLNSDAVRENAEFMQELGLTITQENVAAYEAHDSAMDRSAMVIKALTTTVGNALMPVLTKLAEWFNAVGPAAVVVVRGAIGGLVSVFWGLKNAATITFEAINAAVYTVAEPIRALASAMWKLAQGDFKGAEDELSNWPERIGAVWQQAWGNMVASSEEARDKIANLFMEGNPADAAAAGGNRTVNVKGPKGAADKSDKGESSFMRYYEAMLAEDKRAQSALTDGREYTKEQELAFWRFLTETAQLTSQDRIAIARRTATLEVDIARQANTIRQQLDAENTQAAQKLALARIDTEAAAAKAALDLGQITKAQLAGLEIDFQQRRYEIAAAALQQRMELLALDPDANPVERARIMNELLLLEEQHKAKRAALMAAKTTEDNSAGGIVASMLGSEATWQNMFSTILQNTQNWRQAMGSIFANLGQTFLRDVVIKPMAEWAAAQAKMLLIKMGFLSAEKGAQAASSAATVAMKASEATAVVGANAAEAGSGAAASQASIPIVGPYLALAAMAAIFAAVGGLGKGVKSASGGYNIPSFAEPLTQLHQEEMVLPSPLANAVRRMAAQGEEGGGQQAAAGPAPMLMATPLSGGFWVTQEKEFARFFKDLQRNRMV